MSNKSELVPVEIINSLGIKTTVRRKSSGMPADSTLPVRSPGDLSTPKSRRSVVFRHLMAMGVSKSASTRVAKKAAVMGEDAVEALIELLNHADPHNAFRSELLGYFEPHHDRDPALLSEWLLDSNDHFHAVASTLHELHGDDFADDVISRVTKETIEGIHHYRESGTEYTRQQIRDLVVCTALAYFGLLSLQIKHERPETDIFAYDSVVSESYERVRSCTYLASPALWQIITSSESNAREVTRIITDESIYTEAGIKHRIDGLPKALVSGVL